ncbi:MAG: membrane integrity-associated transporter subunit PqiC [Deltaproteobacteria bacterium]|jgi:uncharacterized lipoprotein YmbA|nr:membrane integrity-associated transporter subunit PqiC [Deltaproteobacteria bacterium]
MRNAALSSLLLLLVACASSPAQQTLYLLHPEPAAESGLVGAPRAVGLARVGVAPYLAQTGIVVQTEPGQLQVARLHHWAEPLEAGLRSLMRAEMSRALGYEVSDGRGGRADWDYTIDVYVDRLHGSMTGRAVLDASYRIAARAGGSEVVEYRFSSSVPLPRAGYPGLVDAQADLARQLARAIPGSLLELEPSRAGS